LGSTFFTSMLSLYKWDPSTKSLGLFYYMILAKRMQEQ